MNGNSYKQMNLIEQTIRRIVKEEISKFNSIELNDEVLSYARKFNSLEEFLRSGGLPIDLLDRLAFGFSDEDIKTLSPSQIKIKWKEDLENVLWEIEKSGLSKIQWSKKINLSEPVDVSFEKNNFYLEDGHHRYVAAKILKKPLNVNLEIKSSPVKKINPNISYDKLMTLIFNKSIELNEQKIYLKEYINRDMVSLKHYFSMPDEQKYAYLPYDYSYMFNDFIEEEGIDFEAPKTTYIDGDGEEFGEEMQDYEIIDWLSNNNKQLLNSFGEYLFNKIQNYNLDIPDSDYPAWSFFDNNPELIKNQWLIHFTNEPDSIANEGFKYGVDEMEKLGLTTHLGDFDKKYGGYNFAYLLSDFKRYGGGGNFSRGGEYKYGKRAVIFRASGIRIYHNSDQEPQVIFYGNTATNIIPLNKGETENWGVYNRKTWKLIYESGDLEKIVYWLERNYPQYRSVLHESISGEPTNNPSSKYHSNIGMSTEDAFDLIDYYDAYRDLYPNYNSNGENEYEQDYYYKTEEEAYKEVNEILDFFNSLPNPIKIYRSIKVKSKEDIDFGYPGDSWSFDKQSAINFAKNQAGGNFLLMGKTNHSNIDWESSIKCYFQFSMTFDGYDENEIKIIDSDDIFDITTEKIRLKVNEEIEDYRGEHEAPSKEDAPMHDLTGTYPEDIYSNHGANHYGDNQGDSKDMQSISIVKAARNRPNYPVKIYRAIPDTNKNVTDQLKQLYSILDYYNKFNWFPSKDKSKLAHEMTSKYYNQGSGYVDNHYELVLGDIYEEIERLKSLLIEKPKINDRDWVTINLEYAKEHGRDNLKNKFKIVSKTVKASQLFTDGNSIHEWGYNI